VWEGKGRDDGEKYKSNQKRLMPNPGEKRREFKIRFSPSLARAKIY
jgi:hypothetical protein